MRCRYAKDAGYCRSVVGGIGGSVGATKTMTSSYQTFTQEYITNPETSTTWKWADFANYHFGIEGWGTSSKHEPRCTQYYVEIEYESAALKYTELTGVIAQGVIIK